MKRYILFPLLLFILICNSRNSIAQNQTKTLFGSQGLIDTKKIGFFVAPSYGLTQMDGSNSTLLNLRGGISFREKFTLGAHFNASHNEARPQSETVPNLNMEYWMVGGFFEYTVLSKKAFHFTFPLYVGYAEVGMNNETSRASFGKESFLQIEPSALFEVNLFIHARFNLGAGYRFVGPMEYRNLNESNISGLTFYFGLKFGLFR